MIRRILNLLFIFALVLAACESRAQVARDLTLKVSDDIGQALEKAEVMINFEKLGGREENKGLTNEAGEFGASAEISFETNVLVNKLGYYGIRIIDIGRYGVPTGKSTLSLVMPRVLGPTALHALHASLKLPEQDEWLGLDLAMANWMPPHGVGKVADIYFKYKSEFVGWKLDENKLASARQANRDKTEEEIGFFYGKWRGKLEISFPTPREGVAEETERYWYYNELRLPHSAPEEGYQPGLRYEANTYEPRQPEKLVGYYLRTRVKLDDDGNIVSANYAKIYGDLRFDARGTVSFWYYFNPTPNDRNLEFDPSRNLFPQSMKGANVSNP